MIHTWAENIVFTVWMRGGCRRVTPHSLGWLPHPSIPVSYLLSCVSSLFSFLITSFFLSYIEFNSSIFHSLSFFHSFLLAYLIFFFVIFFLSGYCSFLQYFFPFIFSIHFIFHSSPFPFCSFPPLYLIPSPSLSFFLCKKSPVLD